METKLRIILLLLLFFTMSYLLKKIRGKKLLLQYSLSWLLLLVGLFVVIAIPDLLQFLAHVLGIESVMNMVFFLGFCFSLVIIYGLTHSISKLSQQVKILTQKVALLEKENEIK